MRHVLALIAFTLLAACTPPAPAPAEGDDASIPGSSADAISDPLALAAAPVISEDIGIPVSLAPRVSRTDGDWGWIVAQPWTPEGAAIDWSQTRHASRAENGAMDSSGTVYVLLKRENGAWRVVEHTIAPTDVAWLDWPQRHGAPESLFVTE